MKPPLSSLLAASILLAGCGGGLNVAVVVGDHRHADLYPITLTQLSACPNSSNGYLSDVFGCMIGTATGQVGYSNQLCSLVISESGRITLGIAGSNYQQSFYVFPDNAFYTKLPGLGSGSFELNTGNRYRNFSMQVAWPGAILPSGATVARMSVLIDSLSCEFLL